MIFGYQDRMMKYFAYGSNLSHAQMRERCPDSQYVGTAVLGDYEFVYDGYAEVRKGAVANVVPAAGKWTVGAVYEVSDADLQKLDICEQVAQGTYYRTDLMVMMREDGEELSAATYLRDPLPIGEPSDEYATVIEQGKGDCGIEVASVR